MISGWGAKGKVHGRRGPGPPGRRCRQRGFTLVEMLVSMALTTLLLAAVFEEMNTAMQRATAEQMRTDLFQEAREFMDQMNRDLHQAGYPNPRNFGAGQLTAVSCDSGSYVPCNNAAAVGLVKVAPDQLIFEADLDGNGTVYTVNYHLDSSAAGCAPPAKPCLRRSQTLKTPGDPVTTAGNATYQTEVQNIQNDVTKPEGAIFYAYTYDDTDTPVTLPIQLNPSGGSTDPGNLALSKINTIKVLLMVQSRYPDQKTGEYPYATVVSTIKLNNCSQSPYSGEVMSCE